LFTYAAAANAAPCAELRRILSVQVNVSSEFRQWLHNRQTTQFPEENIFFSLA
jgi:hypothetical protein